MKQTKWKFKNIDVYFVDPANKLVSATYREAARLGIDPTKTKIEIINEFFNDDSAGCSNCSGNPTGVELTSLQMDDSETEVEPTADDMRDMLGLLDQLSGKSFPAGNTDFNDDTDGIDGSLAD